MMYHPVYYIPQYRILSFFESPPPWAFWALCELLSGPTQRRLPRAALRRRRQQPPGQRLSYGIPGSPRRRAALPFVQLLVAMLYKHIHRYVCMYISTYAYIYICIIYICIHILYVLRHVFRNAAYMVWQEHERLQHMQPKCSIQGAKLWGADF